MRKPAFPLRLLRFFDLRLLLLLLAALPKICILCVVNLAVLARFDALLSSSSSICHIVLVVLLIRVEPAIGRGVRLARLLLLR